MTKTRMAMGLMGVLVLLQTVSSAPLAPDDASIQDGLVSWHRNAAANYTDGVWKSNVGADLVALGDAEDGLDFFEAPELSTLTPEEGYFGGLSEVNGVLFLADQSDMLWAEELTGGNSFEELTLIAVYQTLGNSDRTRPVGIGSWTESKGASNFNLSSDASLRYDNGNNQSDPFFQTPDLTFRAGAMLDGLVWDYLDGDVINEEATPGGSFDGVTRNDNLFVGDVRGGLVEPFTAADPQDIFVAEVIVYQSALTDAQIAGIGEWLTENLGGSSVGFDFDGDGSLGLGDVDVLRDGIISQDVNPSFDINGDGTVSSLDLTELVESATLLNTYLGDANLDGEFNSGDFVVVFTAGQYEDDVDGNATWSTGDWNADGDFDSSDFVVAFSGGGYEVGPRAATQAVPEPTSCFMLLSVFGCITLTARHRRSS